MLIGYGARRLVSKDDPFIQAYFQQGIDRVEFFVDILQREYWSE